MRCGVAVIDIELLIGLGISFVVINTSGPSTHSFYTGALDVRHSPSLSVTFGAGCIKIIFHPL